MKKTTDEKKVKKGKVSLKVVYIHDTDKNQFEVTDNNPESRVGATAVAPSSYDRTAINHKITQEDIDSYPELADHVLPGDIVDERYLNVFIGKDDGSALPLDDEDNKTDEELNQE